MSDPLIIALALIAVPIACGCLAGRLLRRRRGERFRGLTAAVAFVVLPVAAAVALDVRIPIVGLWDAAQTGLLIGLGLSWSAHRLFDDGRNVLLLGSATIFGAMMIELGARLFLPPPPGFPIQHGPHLLLADALRGDLTRQPWDTLSKDLVCSIVYGDGYRGIFDSGRVRRDIVTPRTFEARPAARRVLHLGDSMAFGFGLARGETFTAELDRLQSGVQHINAAIPGTAPDAYLALLDSWIEAHRIDAVVMHVYEGNDLDGLDSVYPCCDWQSLLVYGGDGAALRCRQPTQPALGRAGFTWLRYHTPPPYLLRAAIGSSSAAAHIAAAMNREPYFLFEQPFATRLGHLEQILRTARATLEARGIAFAVHVLPARSWLEASETWQRHGPSIVEAAQRAGVSALDTSDVLRTAVAGGQSLFFENRDIHFNANGHRLLAKWLHERTPVN
jgi:hypothetical protein